MPHNWFGQHLGKHWLREKCTPNKFIWYQPVSGVVFVLFSDTSNRYRCGLLTRTRQKAPNLLILFSLDYVYSPRTDVFNSLFSQPYPLWYIGQNVEVYQNWSDEIYQSMTISINRSSSDYHTTPHRTYFVWVLHCYQDHVILGPSLWF